MNTTPIAARSNPLTAFASIIAGGLTPFAIAPFTHWWLGIITLAALAHILSHNKRRLLHSSLFGAAYYAVGASWVYISIHDFGYAPAPLALLLTTVFVLFLALVFALPFYAMKWIGSTKARLLLGFPLLWGLSEWLRSWLLTGFPWLYIGYGHFNSPLIGWAPVGGVMLLGLFSAFSSSVLCLSVSYRHCHLPKCLGAGIGVAISSIWLTGALLQTIHWTKASGEPIEIGIVQPNIPLEKKWDPSFRQFSLDLLSDLSAPLWGRSKWVIWPEAAVPDVYFSAVEFMTDMQTQAQQRQSALITGILYDDNEHNRYYNSVIGLGLAQGIYFKQRLVPFGEYVPLETWLRGIIDFFNLPNSVITAGPKQQANLHIGKYTLAASICYEIVYPALVAQQVKTADALLTISNDAWFGESIGPLQHFHMARMRAIETGRFVIRGTNNGISAIITPQGDIQQQSPQFVATVLSGTISPMQGNTPYLIWRNNLFLLLLAGLTLALALIQKKQFTVNKATDAH